MIRLTSTRLLDPLVYVASREWLPRYVNMPQGTETAGMPFSLSAFPHCAGPIDAFDDPTVRRIVLQWGTRLGKTTTCLALMGKVAATNPRNMMFASSTKDSASRVIGSRLYPILRSTEGVRDLLPPEARQSRLHVMLGACQIFVGWSGSDTSLADVGAYFGVANEIDKWSSNVSDEADPLRLFVNRCKGFPDHKMIFESTPTIKGRSRIEKAMQESRQHRRQVPCPHCGEFQELRKGTEDTPGGFRWERDSRGTSDATLAYDTAWYECQHCRGRIDNHHRTTMLRDGVWCPAGCRVNVYGELVGTPDRQHSDTVGFGPLASWYALTQTWGDFARMWIACQRRPRDLQDCVNSYMAETWEARQSKSTPEKIGERLRTEVRRGVVPVGSLFITVTVDRQAADGGFAKWIVLAHGAEERRWLVDYGVSVTLAELWDTVFRRHWPCEDNGPAMQCVAAGIDSGWDTKNTYDFCSTHPGVVPIKGAGTDLYGKPYDFRKLEKSETGMELFWVNTDFWETELQTALDERMPGEAGSLSLCREAAGDIDLLTELCNGILTDSVDNRGNAKMLWKKKEDNIPNDFRDAIRYGICLARAWTDDRGGLPGRETHGTTAATARAVSYSGDRRPDGRQWNE